MPRGKSIRLFIETTLIGLVVCVAIYSASVLAQVGEEPVTKNQPKPIEDPKKSQLQSCNVKLSKISGKIYSLQHDDETTLRMSLMSTKILVNHGQFISYPREDGTFEVDRLPPDSYVIEVTHPKFIYEPIRVDITSKGRIRARRVNHIQPALVQTLDYPLIFKPRSLHNYFMSRETWRLMDILLNPMVIMMVVPLGIIWLLPKMMNPQEMQAQRENVQMPDYNVPELSEMMASMFGQQKQQSTNDGPGSASQAALTAAGSSSSSRHGKGKRR